MTYLVTWSIGVTLADVRSSGVRMGSPKTKKKSHGRLNKSIKKEERKGERDERGIVRPTEG